LLQLMARLPRTRQYRVGFSGGADSTALLHALYECRAELQAPIHAIHFHHGLNAGADDWQQHCREFCLERGIEFTSCNLEIKQVSGTSTEEESRNRRYQAIGEILQSGDIYLTAHHADDQAETLFLNLMRGSGMEGLAGIPDLRRLGKGWVARPLLNTGRDELEAYLNRHGIAWLEDPSNKDESFDRNFLRNSLFPQLEKRWPGVGRRLTRSARTARMTATALADFLDTHSGALLSDRYRMPLPPLLQLEPPMRALVLRQWLRRQEIPAISEARLNEFLRQLASSTSSSQPEVKWDGWQLKLFGQLIWLQGNDIPVLQTSVSWTAGLTLELGGSVGCLQLRGNEVSIPGGWQAGSRQPGARIRLHEQGARRKLKDLFRESAIPPWMRASIPVLYWDGEAVAVGDWLIACRLRNWLETNELEYLWKAGTPLLRELQSACHALAVDPSQPLS
jgi:tRNA(Ile)-lysidine synthase